MAFTYINSQGITYILQSKETTVPDGVPRRMYYFVRGDVTNGLNELPEGFEVCENCDGLPIMRHSQSHQQL